ncbi:MAG: phosphoenolpyruvate carboxykinase (GTP) [Candidatus Diapherotrites archaeon]|uniref:Phosphoenolpyruvate carboxykinase [GTP] n=1 Tax=Candidatus Iainarchaeum sp. TaxID=3101447 RepID=A0A2D6LZU5_9ARCH|nr:phosphoenolpyruvate carboxykinase (GTP) [Candidatus Diapherotrites archaeon]
METMFSLMDEKSKEKLTALKNPKVEKTVAEFAEICKPDKITVLNDSQEDIDYVRGLAIKNGEEQKLGTEGHTVHFDGYNDQARDKAHTVTLLSPGMKITKALNSMDRDQGLKEIFEIFVGCMKGKEMLVMFYCLGPTNSEFSIPALQITDSGYVGHSENILYRQGYKEFEKLQDKSDFFYFVHSAGELENYVSKNVDKRRIYIDLDENRVFTVNNQYAGNSVGLKKLALRLAIKKASEEDWLTEHMFVMGLHPKGKDRVTYITGAFPSACGKTSTAMLSGQTIIGDDIAYVRISSEGEARAVNIEQGIFGIIRDVDSKGDPHIFESITTPREAIFSNVLIKDTKPYWLGMGQELPKEGVNHSGEWKEEAKDKNGNEITASHKNARYTIRLSELENMDEKADAPDGVPVSAFVYGGRDSDTTVPVAESLSWPHGVFMGAAVESETTAATLGAEGQRVHNPMANLDFLVIPFGKYIEKHMDFGEQIKKPIKIFSTNYFLKEDGKYLNGMLDKKVWVLWAEGRIHNDFEAIETPIGFIPKYEDLKQLFKQYLNQEYPLANYTNQFSIRIDKYLDKLTRVEPVFRDEGDVPQIFWDQFEQQKQSLLDAKEKFGKSVIEPNEFLEK